ncbi:class I SAM-dependent methyltransferase [Salinarimonas sp.]|uniref:class I SAM-dependent methyltransferase n=1 Tax=Salinarimonas sp. TaxID=2766526 RepID=UPI0032D8C7D4
MSDLPGDVLRRMRRELERIGYFAVVSSLYPVAVYDRPEPLRPSISDPMLSSTVALFHGGARVPAERLPSALVPVLQDLAAAGVLVDRNEAGFSIAPLMLSRTLGIALFHERPSPRTRVYFGNESIALGLRLEPRHGDAVLDLCAGPGFQSLVAARTARRVVAVEINPVAASVLSCNAALNGLDDIVVRCTDLASFEDEDRFDLVVANPPLVPVPAGTPFPFVGDGGPDGLDVTRVILSRLDRWMAPESRLQLIGFGFPWIDGERLPSALGRLASVDLDLLVTVSGVFAYKPGAPAFEMMVESIAGYGGVDATEARERVGAHAEQQDLRLLLSFVARGERAASRRIRTVDFGRTPFGGWYA